MTFKFRRPLAPILMLAALGAAPAQADDVADLAGLGEPDLVIDAAELRTYGTSYYEIEEALALRAGISFHSSGDTASEDWVLVRGWPRDSSRNVLVLVDGVPINNASSESVELHDLPVSLLTRAEVYKPPLPARYGGYHAVLHLRTAHPEQRGVQALAALGSFDTQRGELGATGERRGVRATLETSFLSSDSLTGMSRTPPLDNLVYEDRSYWDVAPTLLVSWAPRPDTSVTLLSLYSRGRKMFSDDEYRNRWFSSSGLGVDHRLNPRARLHADLFFSREHFFLRLDMHPDISRQERVKQGGHASATVDLPLGNRLVTGADFTRNAMEDPAGAYTFHTFGAYVEDQYRPHPRVLAVAGLRWDGSDVDRFTLNPSLELRAEPWAGGIAFARYGRSTRWPSLGEVPADRDIVGETLTGGAAGVRQQVPGQPVQVAVTGFALQLDDELAISPELGGYVNAEGRSTSRGVEVELWGRALPKVPVFASYTYDLVRGTDGKRIAYGPPKHAAGGGIMYLAEAGTLRLGARYLGTKRGIYQHQGQPTTVQDALIVDAYVGRAVGDGLSAFVNVGNLFNVRYETFQGRPMFPRTVVVGLELFAR